MRTRRSPPGAAAPRDVRLRRGATPPSRERIGDFVLALVICALLVVSPLVTIVRHGFVLRDDVPRAPVAWRLRIDPNVATVGLMPVLPGVGPVLAARIDEARRRMPFRDADDLLRVYGIGPVTLAALRPHLRFGPTRTSPGP